MARREVNISLTDVEVAGFLAMIEINLQESLIDPESVQKAEKLCDKLNAALNEFAQPEEPSDTSVSSLGRNDLERIAFIIEAVYDNDPEIWLNDDKDFIKDALTKVQPTPKPSGGSVLRAASVCCASSICSSLQARR
jgi:hypothetical protein